MRKLCVGIDIAKSKFDVMYTIDGENYFGYSTFPNDKKGIKKFVKQAEKFLKQKKQFSATCLPRSTRVNPLLAV